MGVSIWRTIRAKKHPFLVAIDESYSQSKLFVERFTLSESTREYKLFSERFALRRDSIRQSKRFSQPLSGGLLLSGPRAIRRQPVHLSVQALFRARRPRPRVLPTLSPSSSSSACFTLSESIRESKLFSECFALSEAADGGKALGEALGLIDRLPKTKEKRLEKRFGKRLDSQYFFGQCLTPRSKQVSRSLSMIILELRVFSYNRTPYYFMMRRIKANA
jgi:hypothetical protein